MHSIIRILPSQDQLVKKMKRNLSLLKLKLSKLLVCTLLIAFVFQITAISMVQATSETIPRSNAIQPSSDDTVVLSNDDPIRNATIEEPVLIATEDGEKIAPENSTITRDKEIKKNIPEDNSTIGIPEDSNEEDYQPLIAPQPQTVETSAYLGVAVLLAAVAVGTVVFVARRSKKIVG
jgi:hypothetical protein